MADTRTKLLVRAEELLRSRGYSGFSYADLSETVGIRKASIHHHYSTKEVLVATVLQGYRDRYNVALDRIEQETSNALDRIDAYARLYFIGIDKGLGCLCAALSSELEILPASLRLGTVQFFREHIAWLDKVYAIGLARSEVQPSLRSSEAARMVLSALEGALLMERLLDGRNGFEATLGALKKSLAPD